MDQSGMFKIYKPKLCTVIKYMQAANISIMIESQHNALIMSTMKKQTPSAQSCKNKTVSSKN